MKLHQSTFTCLAIVVTLALSACGNKGPLTLPTATPAQPKPAPTQPAKPADHSSAPTPKEQ